MPLIVIIYKHYLQKISETEIINIYTTTKYISLIPIGHSVYFLFLLSQMTISIKYFVSLYTGISKISTAKIKFGVKSMLIFKSSYTIKFYTKSKLVCSPQ